MFFPGKKDLYLPATLNLLKFFYFKTKVYETIVHSLNGSCGRIDL